MTYCTPGGQPGKVAVEALEEGLDSGFCCMGQTMSFLWMMGSGSSSVSSGSWTVRYCIVKPGEEESPAGLTGVESFGFSQIL